MIKIENAEVFGWEAAIRGMRNPLESWEKSDSQWWCIHAGVVPIDCETCYDHCDPLADIEYRIGKNDLDLMKRLRNAGSDHGKFMRMITVYLDITAPLYWWKEFDTYKVGTVVNSCSTMHTIHKKKFELDDFSHEHMNKFSLNILKETIHQLEYCRRAYLESKDTDEKKGYWWQLIQLLPSSYNQKRTVMLNYEVLRNIYHARKNHKLDEWHDFCDRVDGLPYSKLITGKERVLEYASKPGLAYAAAPVFRLGC